MYPTLEKIIAITFFLSTNHAKFTTSLRKYEARTFAPEDNNFINVKGLEKPTTDAQPLIEAKTWMYIDENSTDSSETDFDKKAKHQQTKKPGSLHHYFDSKHSTTKLPKWKIKIQKTDKHQGTHRSVTYYPITEYEVTDGPKSSTIYDDALTTNDNITFDSESTTESSTHSFKPYSKVEIHNKPTSGPKKFTIPIQKFTMTKYVKPLKKKNNHTKFYEKYVTPRTWTPEEDYQRQSDVKKCPYYRGLRNFNIDAMVDVWETVYYRTQDKVNCFRIFIKKLKKRDKQILKKRYSNYSDEVDWNRCDLEIKAATAIGRRHFLQHDGMNNGIMDNIILTKDRESGSLTARVESPDQWFLHNHLLLMRDCLNGGVVVFAKVPFVPTRRDLEEGLEAFHDSYGAGLLTCEEDLNSRPLQEQESDEDFLV